MDTDASAQEGKGQTQGMTATCEYANTCLFACLIAAVYQGVICG